MTRTVLAVIGGYAAMFVLIFVSFSVLYLILGTERSFQPGSYDASLTWNVLSTILSIAAAVTGGIVCAQITTSPAAPKALAVVVLVLGLVLAIPMLTADPDPNEIRPAEVSGIDAMQNARQPLWIAFLNPVIGAVGVIVGAGMVTRKEDV